jgi:lysophospholipase L1-like esterase
MDAQRWAAILVAAALLLGAARLVPEHGAVHTSPQVPKSLLVVGDSLAGNAWASTQGNGFAPQVATDLGLALTDYAQGGVTVGGALANDPNPLPAASVTVLELGTNDLWAPTNLATFRRDYAALLARIPPGGQVVCLGLWQNPSWSNSLGLATGDYDAVIRQMCPGVFVPLRGLFVVAADHATARQTTWIPGVLSDSFHPGDRGHTAIASVIEAALVR